MEDNKKTKKRILMIAATPFYLEKGSSLRVYAMLEILSKNYYIDLVTYPHGEDKEIPGLNIYRVNFFRPKVEVSKPTIRRLLLDFLLFLKCFWLLLKNKYDIIHCEDFGGAYIGYFLGIFFRNKKRIYDLHNRVIENLERKNKNSSLGIIFLFLEKKIIRKIDLLIVNWPQYLKDELFKNKNKIHIYDKISLKIKKTDINYGKYILYSGNFEEYQGIHKFIEVYKHINTDVKLLLLGDAPKKLIEEIKMDNLSSKILFLGRKSIEESNGFIKNSYFCIMPRILGEMPSMKVLHYLVWGKPVLANNIKCNYELLDKDNSVFYNEKDLEEKIYKLLVDEKRIKSLSCGAEKAREKIMENWNQDSFLYRYKKAIS